MRYGRVVMSRLLFCLGDFISRPMCRFDLGFLYPLYSKLMDWSVSLDSEGRVRKTEL